MADDRTRDGALCWRLEEFESEGADTRSDLGRDLGGAVSAVM